METLEADMEIQSHYCLKDMIDDAAMNEDVFTDANKTRDIQMCELD